MSSAKSKFLTPLLKPQSSTGQELTARTHHVGETRKRLVPVKLTEHVDDFSSHLPARLTMGKFLVDIKRFRLKFHGKADKFF